MSLVVPDLLLSLPSPLDGFERFVVDGKLQLSIGDGEAQAGAYRNAVAAFLRGVMPDERENLEPSIAFALRVFNAENFTGELTPSEREKFRPLFQHFGGVVDKTYRTATSGVEERGDADEEAAAGGSASAIVSVATRPAEQLENLKDMYLQRLLTTDGEMPVACMRLPGLLLAALAMVDVEVAPDAPLLPLSSIWRLRVHYRHQLCLSHRSHAVFVAVADSVDAILRLPEEELTVGMLLEVGHAQSYYHRRDLAAEMYWRAARKSGLKLEESSMMGVRTRWQQHQLVQLILNATSTRPVPPESTTEEQPKTVMSEKDGHDLLDRPRERPDAEPVSLTPLHPEDKAIILALCRDIRNTNPHHGLTQHHMMTYIERLLVDPAPSPFMIRCQTLLMRARLESRRNRVQERSFMQFAALSDQYSALHDTADESFHRTESEYFYTVDFPTIWGLKKEYADFCHEETLFKTALDIYEQTLDWESIIDCCKKLDKRRRAESLARDLLEKDPLNPMLWVALGEATRDDAHLWKAWELCDHRMAAPMRALASFAMDRQHYEKVVEYFDEAVRINPVFGGDWFSLGYASLRLNLLDRSSAAFTRVCQIDPTDAFAWNNLASVMLREGKVRLAFNAMSQAIRNNRRDWRMWQNYFVMGCQLKEISETTNALGIAVDIAQRQMQIGAESIMAFVDNTIQYLRGDISGSCMDTASDEVSQVSGSHAASRHGRMTTMPNESDIAHAPLVQGSAISASDATAGAEEGDEETVDLVPLGADLDFPDEQVSYRSADGQAGAASNEAVMASIRGRHAERVRALFDRLLDIYVSDPNIYGAAATLICYLDGPLAAYHYRQKELRAGQQKDQWMRSEALFARVVQCLSAASAELSTALDTAMEADGAALKAPGPRSVGGVDGETDEAASGTAAAVVLTGPSLHTVIIGSLKELHINMKAALMASEEHLKISTSYQQLRSMADTVRERLQEAKAAFV